MKKMKRILFIVGCMVSLCVCANATTMCSPDDTITMVFDPTQNGTNITYNAGIFEWRTDFSYGSVYGIATCITHNSGSPAATLMDNGELVTGGEHTGQYCWCKMTHPAVSRWVFRNAFSSVSDCRLNCATYCGHDVRNNAGFRGSVFGSLGD